jgi:hypothetical protein
LFGKFGSVKIDLEGTNIDWNNAWPDGIKLVNK